MSGVESTREAALRLKGEVEEVRDRAGGVEESANTIQQLLVQQEEQLSEVRGLLREASEKAQEWVQTAHSAVTKHTETAAVAKSVANDLGSLATSVVELLTNSSANSAENAQTSIMHSHAAAKSADNNFTTSQEKIDTTYTAITEQVSKYITDALASMGIVGQNLELARMISVDYISNTHDATQQATEAASSLGEYAEGL